jgi:hypothetical protein
VAATERPVNPEISEDDGLARRPNARPNATRIAAGPPFAIGVMTSAS